MADQLAAAMDHRNGQTFTELIAILPSDEADQVQELALILTKREKFVTNFLAEAEKEFLANKINRNYRDENGQTSTGNGQNEAKLF